MRVCESCGRPVYAGMTNKDGDFYTHEGECFYKYMDDTYGKHRWMAIEEEDEYGGYYLTAEKCCCGYIGTGIYYTEWYDEEED